MSQIRCVAYWAIAAILVFFAARPSAAGVLRYDIEPGGQYTYLASGESIGIAGCSPSDFECLFGIDGSFSVMADAGTDIATLLDVDLTLIGHDEAQQNALTPFVTAEGVADWLEDRSFRDLQVLGPFTLFADEEFPDLVLTDLLTGTVTLSGGFDHRAFDGDGVQFEVTAVVVPEPSSIVLLAVGLAVASALRRAIVFGRAMSVRPRAQQGADQVVGDDR